MPRDIPGFYYDAEKNRYFPLKGKIPGRPSSSSSASKSAPKPSPEGKLYGRSGTGTSKLLLGRELYGNTMPFDKGKLNFKEEIQKIQASQPVITKYQGTDKIGDGALKQINMNVLTSDGQMETDVLLTGGINGSLSFSVVGKAGQQFNYWEKCMPVSVWPHCKGKKAEAIPMPGHLWTPAAAALYMSSNISCIKLFRKDSCCTGNSSSIQQALITTLGSDASGGSINILDLVEPLELSRNISTLTQRLKEITCLSCTIWTADCYASGSRAVVGTNMGAASVDLETGVSSWVCRSKSDVLAEQVDQSGNIVLCGLRNGAIVTIDAREKWKVFSSRSSRHQSSFSSCKTIGPSTERYFKLYGNIDPSRTIYLPSSISCLVSLQFYDQYFLASSMDGSIKLYDHRLIQRGAVQTYDGHVNSHTRIELGVDPCERFVMSGGEDCYLRLWSIKSGKLLFEEKFSNSIPSIVCWPRAEKLRTKQDDSHSCREYLHGQNGDCRAWLGSQEGLFHLDWPRVLQ